MVMRRQPRPAFDERNGAWSGWPTKGRRGRQHPFFPGWSNPCVMPRQAIKNLHIRLANLILLERFLTEVQAQAGLSGND